MGAPKAWSLEAAREMLPEVRQRTESAVAKSEALLARREDLAPDDPAQAGVEEELREVVSAWTRAMEALGVDVKGLWLVDFDCGAGCYCWRWPETQLEFFHPHEGGFDSRTRIQ